MGDMSHSEKKKLKNLRKFRDGHRKFVEKTIEDAKGLIAEGNLIEVKRLKFLRTALETKYSELQSLDREIVDLVDDVKVIDTEVSESCELMSSIQECIVELESVLEAQESKGKSQKSPSVVQPVSPESAGTSQGHVSKAFTYAKLPKLELKKFHGNPMHWYPFWESFESAVHKNPNLSSVDKFNYLKSLLTGTAQSSVAGLALTSANYEKAVDLLKQRFGNRQMVISSHIEVLTKLPKVESISEVKKLRSLYDTVESHVRGLEGMEISSEMYGCFLTPIVMQKLPEEFRIAITRNLGSETWNLKDILVEFHKELQLREQCLVNNKEFRSSNQRGELPLSTSALYTDSSKDKQSSRVWCSFCNQNHQSSKCNVVTSTESRKEVLKKKGKCFLCLKQGHLARNCQAHMKCHKCQGAHHVAICGDSQSTMSGQDQDNVPSVSTSMYVDQSRGSVLLQTATAEVVRPDNDTSSLSVRLVFDSCSQRSYITKNLKDRLKLPVIGRESLLIKTFGESDARLRTCEIVQVGIKTMCDAIVYIQAYVVPVICGPLTQQPTELAQSSCEHLHGLSLADGCGRGDLPISILIGADHYWSLVEGTIVRGAPWEPVALATKLGYVLSGPTMIMSHNDNGNTVNLTATHVLKVEASVVNRDEIAFDLGKFWDYESLGIRNDSLSLYDKFVSKVEFTEGRYQVQLPFKEDHELLPDNFALCKSRLASLLKRLNLKPKVLKHYDDVIREQEKQGIVEPVEQGTNNGVGKVHYLPHHEVIRVDKDTTKLRIVYDASARSGRNTPSLNDCLYAGPPLSPFIYDVLLRFRVHKVALIGDIEKAFLNVSVHPRDRDYLRFLWIDDVTSSRPKLQVYRFARVAPMNGETIPRLELVGALILARLVNTVLTAFDGTLKVDSVHCWLDSQIALWWIWGVSREFKQFIQNRVVEIRRLTKPAQWNYCPTESNPADICSRGSMTSKLITNQLWWSGPEFLRGEKEQWPSLKMNSVEVTSNDSDPRLELKKGTCNNSKKQHDSSVLVNIASGEATSEKRLNLDCIIPLEKFSSLQRLMRVTAYVLRFVSNLKQSKRKKELIDGEVMQEEMDQARELWIKEVQRSVYNDKNFDQVKVSLSLFTDDKGILRCGGRLKNAPIPYDARFPIFLPRCSRFTYLVINDCHFKVLHNGVRDTLTELRSRFWVTKGRQTVKIAIGNCSVCKKIQGRSYAVPPPPPLPEFRLSDEFAFTRVGVDFAGPIYVKDVFAKNGDMNKVYIALFTCAATRAVHLELVPNLSAESFIRALARFKGRRGIPVLIVSDNGKTFKDSRVQAQCRRDGTQWKFNVEAAPWWGGFFERLVKSVKLSLKKCIRNARLNYDELSTVLVEVEAALNSRPLTYVFDEMEEPLTPSHLIVGRRILSVPSRSSSDEVGQTEETVTLTRRAKFLQRTLDHFWNRWRSEYLTQLREYHRYSKRANSIRKVQVGDIVCLHDNKIPRQLWRLGKVERLLPGRDGQVRSAVVRVKSGNSPTAEWRRPLQRLYPLEVKLDTEVANPVPQAENVPIRVVRDEDVPVVVVNSD